MDFRTLIGAVVGLIAAAWLVTGLQDTTETVSLAVDGQGAVTAPSSPSLFERIGGFTNSLVVGSSSGAASGAAYVRPDYSLGEASEIFTRYRRADRRDLPGSLGTLEPVDGCDVARPDAEHAAHALVTSEARANVPIYPFNRDDMDYDIKLVLRKALFAKDPTFGGDARRAAMPVYDVAVTDTSAPVHLVLQTAGQRAIWNVHLAPGVAVARVALLGGDHVGLAGVEASVPVDLMTNRELARCDVHVSFPAPQDHIIYRSVAQGHLQAKASLAAWQARDAAWVGWVERQFGVASAGPAEVETVTAFLAGPVPASKSERAVFTPVKGESLRLSPSDHVFAGAEWSDAYEAAVIDHVEALAGMPLDELAPKTTARQVVSE